MLLGQGEAQRAAEHFEDLIRRASHYAPAYSFLGATFARLGRADDSVAAFLGAVRLQPDNPTHYFNLGRACRQQDLLYPALRCFEASARLQAPNEALKIAHREALETRKSRLQELSRLWPQLLACGEDAKLLACCNRILALNPDQGGILLWKAGYWLSGENGRSPGRLRSAAPTFKTRF